MIKSGLENTKKVKANFFLPYAGFSKPYVKGENIMKRLLTQYMKIYII